MASSSGSSLGETRSRHMSTARRLFALAILGLAASCNSGGASDGSSAGGAPDAAAGDGTVMQPEGGHGGTTGETGGTKGALAGDGPASPGGSNGAEAGASGATGSGSDPCGDQPCEHGTCHAQGDGYECDCDAGYSGDTCAVDEDDCAAAPCANGGTCVDGVAGFTCDCSTAPGWGGELCTTNIDDCSGNPCLNGGACVDKTDGFTCDCTGTGFDGTYCDHNIDDCAGAPCKHGSCADGVKGYKCSCEQGWEGTNCDVDHNDCAPNPCLNKGVCTDKLAGFSCNCAATGYTGITCQTDIDECKTNNGGCSLNADCKNTPGSWKCGCKAGFAGDGIKCLPAKSGYTVETVSVAAAACDDVSAQPNHVTDSCYLGCSQGGGATDMAAIGFNFSYFGVAIDKFSMARYGYIRPQPVGQSLKPFSAYGKGIPNAAAPNGMIAAFWTDADVPLYDEQNGPNTFVGSVRYGVFGKAPNRHLTAEWRDFQLLVGTTRPKLTFQVKLFETSNAIEFHYCSLTAGAPATNAPYIRGTAATIGLESMDSLKGFAVATHQDNVTSTTSYLHLEPVKGGAKCAAGFLDCDGDPATGTGGCETDVLKDPNHCGACAAPTCAAAPNGTSSNGTITCDYGMCNVACDAGYGNCNGNAADGCERYLVNDTQSCGTCAYYCLDGWGGGCANSKCQ